MPFYAIIEPAIIHAILLFRHYYAATPLFAAITPLLFSLLPLLPR
jgi:hypothetical protein